MIRAFLGRYSQPAPVSGWRGAAWLGLLAVILIALPQARALLTAGILGGVVIGAFLILIRRQFGSPGPRRGTPIVLFPRTIETSI